MSLSLLTTKITVPSSRSSLVQRHRLIEKLHASSEQKLILVSASAGFGKTTLVSSWLNQCKQRVAWLSLDERDNDPTRFWTYVIASLQTQLPTIGVTALAMLQSPRTPQAETLLSALLNDLNQLTETSILVLDDYHVIETQSIHDALSFFLDHLPLRLRLLITTRIDPPLPLARLRVRGQMLEIRDTDLRFCLSKCV